MVPHLSESPFLGAAQTVEWGGGGHLKGLRKGKYKISWSLEARKGPKISSLAAASCSSPAQGICSVLSYSEAHKEQNPKPLLSFLCRVMAFDSEGGGEDSGKRKPEIWFYLLEVIQMLFSIKHSTAIQRAKAAVLVTKDTFPRRYWFLTAIGTHTYFVLALIPAIIRIYMHVYF